ncbi:MAG: hypothetical protein RIQ79_859 [Verrucomicrobiota bacterium]
MTYNESGLVATLAQLHDAYERALAANDVPALNAFFWDSPDVVRYGVAEQLYGTEALHIYRQGHVPVYTSRRLLRRVISVFGTESASVMSEIELVIGGQPGLTRQSQTWIRFPERGWRIVSAHVSKPIEIGLWSNYVTSTARALSLPLAAAHRPGVVANLERTAVIVAPLLAFSLPDTAEPAAVFRA